MRYRDKQADRFREKERERGGKRKRNRVGGRGIKPDRQTKRKKEN